jgi:hypothetical protein
VIAFARGLCGWIFTTRPGTGQYCVERPRELVEADDIAVSAKFAMAKIARAACSSASGGFGSGQGSSGGGNREA